MRIKQVPFHGSVAVMLRVLFALLLAAPIVCQNEAEPYFSLSSTRTFGSGDQPEVMLSGWEVPAVQMRVYRVNDPVKFLSEMQDPHSFGGRNPRPGAKLTLLERIHQWKRELRRDIRLNLRGQFTESPSEHLAKIFPEKEEAHPKTASKETYYAQAPALNQEQLVLSFIQPVTGNDRWSSEAVPIRVKDKGIFLVEAVYGQLRAYTILVVSDAVLLTKTGRAHVLGYFADRETGEPIGSAEIATVVRNGSPATVQTDGNGLADLTVKDKAPEDVRIIAKRGKDVAISNISSWAFSARERNLTGLIYTDRPVYRPGDTAHFRGILRSQEAVGYSVPAQQSISVQITDPDGKAVYQKDLTTNSNGIIHDDLALGKAASLGNYYVEIRSGANQVSGNFEVQEYKKPEYEVRVTPAKGRVLEGESVQATIDARYYFGEPVNNAKVKYSIYRSRYWYPLWYEPDEDNAEGSNDSSNTYDDAAGEQISQEEGKLNEDGKLTVTVPTTVSDNRIDYRYRIEANVTDPAGREISGTGWLTATYGSFLVNVEPSRYFFEPNSTGSFKVQARDYDNRPISTAVHLKLVRWNWHQREETEVRASADSATDAQGSADMDLKIPDGGSYRAVVSARTPEGRIVESSTYVWVAGKGEGWFYGTEEQQSVQIIPDKKSYRVGDTAKILIVAGQDKTPVLVTVEGRDIRSRQLIRSQGATLTFEYPITADDAPGLFVSAQFIRKGQMHQSQKRVKVPPEQHQLCVSVTTDKENYLPGQAATYSLIATSTDGKPVANADLSLSVVDEAIYAIRPDATPNILDTFYGREYNSVYTDNSLQYYFTGEAGTRRMRLAGMRPSSQLAQLKPERVVQPKIRKIFPDTAFWASDITTDASGRAQARVTFPDSLTTWRATIRGVAPENRFGSTTEKTIVRKNLILRLALPRFFVQGDEVTISGIVHNYLKNDKHARVSVTLAGLDLAGSAVTQEVEVPSRGDVKVAWRVKAQQVRQAKVTAQALTNEESDALEFELPVNPPGVSVRQAKGGTIANSGNASFAFTFPPDAVTGSRSLSIRLSPSVAGSLFSALDYLTSFPYGCVEQTMSSFLPDLMVTKAVKELGLSQQPTNQEELTRKTQAGLDRLYSFQHEDGGWGWWQTDESHPFMSAYVVAGLAEARNLGIAINEDAITNGAKWVTADLKNGRDLAPDLRAYMQYSLALAGKPDTAALGRIYGDRSTLSPDGLALLGLALEQVKDGRAADVASQLEKGVKQTGEEAWWPALRDEMLDFEADITPEASAYAMKLLSREHPNSPLLPKAALWLVNHRNEGYWWSSSKQTAMVIYGLIDYIKATKELHPNFTATVLVNGQQAATHAFNSDHAIPAPEITIDEKALAAGNNQIQVSSNGQGRLYYSVSAIHYSNAARLEKQGAVSLNVLRDYFQLIPGKEEGAIVYDLKPLDRPVTPGDTIAVRLTVTGTDWRYLLVEDPIPAGTEFIERDNLYHIRNKPLWWQYWFTRRELHDDRMAIFQTYFNEGQQQYFYLLKVVNPGVFHVSPARVEPMYQPGIEATTEGRTLEAK